MNLTFQKLPVPIRIFLLLSAVFIFGLSLGWISGHFGSEDSRFQNFTEKLFQEEISGNMLTLHYSLAHPEKKNIPRPAPTLGTFSTDSSGMIKKCKENIRKLNSFHFSELSEKNQLTCDMLLLYYRTRQSPGADNLLEEFLSPSLGIQAQLPILLAEYAFYQDQDISDYLNLLLSIEPYFRSILDYEQKKADAGYFMSDTSLDRVLAQCRSFIKDPESNYMLEIFARKLKDYGKFSTEDQQKLITRHKEILINKVIPAYQQLITGLDALRGSGRNTMGLSHFTGGKEYYEYLIRSETGSYDPVEKIRQRLLSQLNQDTIQIQRILKEQPSLLRKLNKGIDMQDFSPEQALKQLRRESEKDFPSLSRPLQYQVSYVHKSMEDFLSPAFYLTPPLDTGEPNVIYINPSGNSSNLNLFTTLSHEGFPGHLYQTVYFAGTDPSDIRYLISCGGYVEGWATYVESYGYQYAAACINDPAASDLASLSWLNRSLNLCIYSLTDIGIHYQGWSQETAASFLSSFGITDKETLSEIYQYILETPANYLKYYVGYLNFLDLLKEWQDTLGKNFNLKEFHRKILEMGPVSFPVLKKYMNRELNALSGTHTLDLMSKKEMPSASPFILSCNS